MNRLTKALTAVLALLMLTSCSLIEMREVEDTDKPDTKDTSDSVSADTTESDDTEPAVTDPAEEEPTLSEKDIRIAFVGNIDLDDENMGADIDYFANVKSAVSEADISFGVLSSSDVADVRTFIEPLGLDIVEVSRSSFYGEQSGLSFTKLSSSGAVADSMKTMNVKSVNFAFISVGGAYSSAPYTAEATFDNIEYADFVADIVTVYVDWENHETPDDKYATVKKMASSGADIIIGTDEHLGKVEWIDNEDGTRALFVHSLGNIFTDSYVTDELYGAVLEFAVIVDGQRLEIDGIKVSPTFVHCEEGHTNHSVYNISDYTEELAEKHIAGGLTYEKILTHVTDLIPAEFLPNEYSHRN